MNRPLNVPALVKDFADCGTRSGLTDDQHQNLEDARTALAQAMCNLVNAYKDLPAIVNSDTVLTLETAVTNDADRLARSAVRTSKFLDASQNSRPGRRLG